MAKLRFKDEVWKDVPKIEFLQVSDLGNVREHVTYIYQSFYRPKNCGTYKNKYVWTSHLGKKYSVHRLIATTFHPNPERKGCVNHKNGIRNDNRAVNLEWCTIRENNLHAAMVLKKRLYKAVDIYKDGAYIRTAISMSEAGRIVGGIGACVDKVCKGRMRKYKGFTFKFATRSET